MAAHVTPVILICHEKLFSLRGTAVFCHRKNSVGFSSCMDIIVVAVLLYVSGIIDIKLPVFRQSAAGVDAASVPCRIRRQKRACITPADQIRAFIMSPELFPSLRIKRRILKIYVIDAVFLAQSVGIVQPAGRRHQMMPEPPAVLTALFLRAVLSCLYPFLPSVHFVRHRYLLLL